jgi:hypothetical protein
MSAAKRDRGQAAVITVLFTVVLLGVAAAVLDIGAWYRADRDLQATMDAAALAGAQALPADTGEADALATEYADKNGGGLDDVEFSTDILPNDTIAVTGTRPAEGVFTRLFGIDSVTVEASAKARTGVISSARWVAPVTVSEEHPLLPCAWKTSTCYGDEAVLELINLHGPGSGNAAGSFGLLDLRPGGNGSAGNSDVASWMSKGFDEFMPVGTYEAVPSTMFNSAQFRDALDLRVGTEVLFPIYRPPIQAGGSNARFDIIGWVGFHVLGFSGGGSSGKVNGWFTQVIWEGIQAESPSAENFGAYSVTLVD